MSYAAGNLIALDQDLRNRAAIAAAQAVNGAGSPDAD